MSLIEMLTEDEIIKEDNLVHMPEDVRALYNYSKQIIDHPRDLCKRQCVYLPLLRAVLEADKGNYQALEDQRQFLIDYSIKNL